MSDHVVKVSPEEQAKKFSEIKEKELEIKRVRTEREYEKILKSNNKVEDFRKLSLNMDDSYAQKIIEKTNKKHESAKKKMKLIEAVPKLSNHVPFYATELILIGARTGTGKTTACVNIAYSMIKQGKKPIVITNEESAEDFLGRLASLFLEKRYGNLEKMEAEVKERIDALIPKLLKLVMVIDADFAKMQGLGIERLTNSIEGLQFIEKKLLESAAAGHVYDGIIIDYYQKFNFSIEAPHMKPWECQEIAASIIENLRVTYPAPLIVFSQMDGQDIQDGKENKEPFEFRIQGRKVIANYASVVIEIIADKKRSSTHFKIHKGRNMEHVEGDIIAGWDSGKYVEYDEQFIRRVNEREAARIRREAGLDGTGNAGTT